MTSLSDCHFCMAGTYSSLEGASICTNCTAGTFSLPKAAMCILCERGSYSPLNGSAICTPCSPGYYAANNGSTACHKCSGKQSSEMLRVNVTCSSVNNNSLCEMNNRCLNSQCTQGIVGRYSPGEDYNNNEVMIITITSQPLSTITILFTSFMTEPDYDVLQIFDCSDSTCENSTLLSTLSGKAIPPPQVSTSGVMQILWSSEVCCPKPSSACPCDDPINANILTGWLAVYYVSGSPACNATSLLRHDGTAEMLKVSPGQSTGSPATVPHPVYRGNQDFHSHTRVSGRDASLAAVVARQFRNAKACHLMSTVGISLQPKAQRHGAQYYIKSGQRCDGSQNKGKRNRIVISQRNLTPTILTQMDKVAPHRRQSHLDRYMICDSSNIAAYGQCIASTYQDLHIFYLPTESNPAFPGLEFQIVVNKKDFYGQTIVTDSSSLLQVFVVKRTANISSFILGTTVVQMLLGEAFFSISMKPIFRMVSYSLGSTQLKSEVSIYVSGIDSEALLNENMRSKNSIVYLSNGTGVCPQGYVLNLESSPLILEGQSGTCLFCKAGTYSVSPLKGPLRDDEPACLNCPLGGDCAVGGQDVKFSVGEWISSDGIYRLVSCPPGFQLQNFISGASFSQDVQICVKCTTDQYIMNSNNPNFRCMKCPVGANCDGNSLKGLVSGSIWRADNVSGIFVLMRCPKVNYVMLYHAHRHLYEYLEWCIVSD